MTLQEVKQKGYKQPTSTEFVDIDKKRGWRTKLYNYTLIIESDSSDKKQYIYLIHEPE